ncbi:prostate stem cell antigen-like [Rana temporaria]|uniref:prostate stem cell antigen-like n=1 Tax=Rana temporaria TaxID=8407 RepID=UPI001AAC4C4C|nr:prostate stem cell antigen-like [Rana temporaria]XP_040179051.1 prostate stem cell antigen-like [Rana temporaria]
MKLLLCLSLIFCLVSAESPLICYICRFEISSFCFSISGFEPCNGVCTTVNVSFGKSLLFTKRGCTTKCPEDFNLWSFQNNGTCCDTQRCNYEN